MPFPYDLVLHFPHRAYYCLCGFNSIEYQLPLKIGILYIKNMLPLRATVMSCHLHFEYSHRCQRYSSDRAQQLQKVVMCTFTGLYSFKDFIISINHIQLFFALLCSFCKWENFDLAKVKTKTHHKKLQFKLSSGF